MDLGARVADPVARERVRNHLPAARVQLGAIGAVTMCAFGLDALLVVRGAFLVASAAGSGTRGEEAGGFDMARRHWGSLDDGELFHCLRHDGLAWTVIDV